MTVLGRTHWVRGVISTDDILPARYKHSSVVPEDLAKHVFEFILTPEQRQFAPNDVLLNDTIFGIGSSREQAVSALLAAGICAVVAPAFGRIFFRNAWNLGLAAIEANPSGMPDHATAELSLEEGIFRTNAVQIRFPPVPPMIINMHRQGGLIEMLKAKLQLGTRDG